MEGELMLEAFLLFAGVYGAIFLIVYILLLIDWKMHG